MGFLRAAAAAALMATASAVEPELVSTEPVASSGLKELHHSSKFIDGALFTDHDNVITPESFQKLLAAAKKQASSLHMHSFEEEETEEGDPVPARKLLERKLRLRAYACCRDLNWEDYRMGAGNDRVCAGMPAGLTCPTFKANYEDARELCNTVGSELCTRTTFNQGEHDVFASMNTCDITSNKKYWTYTPYTCDKNGATGYFTMTPAQWSNYGRSCRAATDTNYFMCCSKNKRRFSTCFGSSPAPVSPSPDGSPSPAGTPGSPAPAPAPTVTFSWIRAAANGVSCTSACAANGLTCVSTQWPAWNSQALMSNLGTYYESGSLAANTFAVSCAGYIGTSYPSAPTQYTVNNNCYYSNSVSTVSNCAGTNTWARNFCYCSS